MFESDERAASFASTFTEPERGSCCASAGVSLSFMPSLKPLTALPRSLPILRSFFVPNTSATISNTISQCQILNPPMMKLS
ncbi:hypothetical protein X946_5400 [Burkholderia sp. ABCPW 111]|nr:hypothetical protein X946_5400 [Burkholderia sp. ABCPW 111]